MHRIYSFLSKCIYHFDWKPHLIYYSDLQIQTPILRHALIENIGRLWTLQIKKNQNENFDKCPFYNCWMVQIIMIKKVKDNYQSWSFFQGQISPLETWEQNSFKAHIAWGNTQYFLGGWVDPTNNHWVIFFDHKDLIFNQHFINENLTWSLSMQIFIKLC